MRKLETAGRDVSACAVEFQMQKLSDFTDHLIHRCKLTFVKKIYFAFFLNNMIEKTDLIKNKMKWEA